MNDTTDRYLEAISSETGSDRPGGCTCSGTYIHTGGDNYIGIDGYIRSYRLYTCNKCDLSYIVDSNSYRLF